MATSLERPAAGAKPGTPVFAQSLIGPQLTQEFDLIVPTLRVEMQPWTLLRPPALPMPLRRGASRDGRPRGSVGAIAYRGSIDIPAVTPFLDQRHDTGFAQ